MDVFRFFIEAISWLRIVASPLLAGVIISAIVYNYMPNTLGIVLAVAIATIGLIVGIVWATRIWKTQGTTNFMSRIDASPELDKREEKNHLP